MARLLVHVLILLLAAASDAEERKRIEGELAARQVWVAT
jgi:uncharacterized lipoprotein YehR (DUF1307 family)